VLVARLLAGFLLALIGLLGRRLRLPTLQRCHLRRVGEDLRRVGRGDGCGHAGAPCLVLLLQGTLHVLGDVLGLGAADLDDGL
jgi:hypothetical protein